MMRPKTIGIYLIILCIILSGWSSKGLIINTQSNQETGIHNQAEGYQVNQNNYLRNNVTIKTNNYQVNNRAALLSSKSESVTSVKANLNSTGFISTWQTNITSPASSNANQITLPLISAGTYDFNVSWGDRSSSLITTYDQSAVTHTYSAPGTYTLNITGTIVGWRFNGKGDAIKLIQISNWGPLRLGNAGFYFYGATNLVLTTTDALDLIGTTNFEGMFEYCTRLASSGDLNSWDLSRVTDLSSMFIGASSFNQSLDSWNVSRVTNLRSMFAGATSFNQPIDSWNVSNVTNMNSMFAGATSFNQPLDSWNVSRVTDMSYMFFGATSFNKSIESWNVSNVTNMESMFSGATNFNQSLASWDVSKVTDMISMFEGATSFNQPVDSWDVSQVTYMKSMFDRATRFNQTLESWNVSAVTDMSSMFATAISFNQSLASWDVSQVTVMNNMFTGAISFNQPLNSWNVSMVTDMSYMFCTATSFNQPLNSWNVSKVTNMNYMFFSISLSISNYDKLLLGWSSILNLKHNVLFDGGNSRYSTSAQHAREKLIKNFGWTIKDGGLFSSKTISMNSSITILLIVIAIVGFIWISIYVLTNYFEYKKTKHEKYKKGLKFWNYLKNKAKFKRHKTVAQETLSSETFDKIAQIIDENKEK